MSNLVFRPPHHCGRRLPIRPIFKSWEIPRFSRFLALLGFLVDLRMSYPAWESIYSWFGLWYRPFGPLETLISIRILRPPQQCGRRLPIRPSRKQKHVFQTRRKVPGFSRFCPIFGTFSTSDRWSEVLSLLRIHFQSVGILGNQDLKLQIFT